MADEREPTDGAETGEPAESRGPDGSSEDGDGRELRKDREAGVLTGVCAGLGAYTRVDPIVWRTAFAITSLAGGTGLWLYAGAWLLMRDSDGGPAMAEQLLDRRFTARSVLTLLGLALAAATVISIVGGVSVSTLMLATPLIIGGLTAHSRGVDLAGVLRDLPKQLATKDPPPAPPKPEPAPTYFNPAQPWAAAPSGPVDLSVIAGQSVRDAEAEGDEDDGDDQDEECRTGWSQRSAKRARQAAETRREHHRARRRERGVLLVGVVFWFVAAVAGITIGGTGQGPWAALLGPETGPVFLGGVAVIAGLALLVGTWFGNGRGLVTLGTVAVLLAATASSTDLTGVRFAEERWRPTTPAEARNYQLDAGAAELDLTAMDLEPGERVDVGANVGFGRVEVLVPETARVDVRATATAGNIRVADEHWSGARLDVRTTMRPPDGSTTPREEHGGGGAEPAELNVRLASYGAAMEVRRVER